MVIVRTTRARIIHLRNDYKDLMATIEKQLHEHFASLNDEEEEDISTNRQQEQQASQLRDSVPETLALPFAKVNSVVDNSPADSAGLKAGDLVRNFGYVNRENHDGLKKVAECVQGNEGVSIPPRSLCVPWISRNADSPSQQTIIVKVLRSAGSGQHQELQLSLRPRRDWGGRGLLGCHIIPI